jgi:hypothetical protein
MPIRFIENEKLKLSRPFRALLAQLKIKLEQLAWRIKQMETPR